MLSNKKRTELMKIFKTYEDFQKFVLDNEITSSTEFKKKFRYIYDLFYEYKFNRPLLFFNGRNKYSSFTLQNVQDHIINCGYTTWKEMNEKERGLVTLIDRRGWRSNIKLVSKEKITNKKESQVKYHIKHWTSYTLEDTQTFINDNKIKSKKEFSKKYSGLKRHSVNLGFYDKLVFEESRDIVDLSYLNTLEDFQNYIDLNNIENAKELNSTKEGQAIYRKLRKLDLVKKIKYSNELSQDLSEYDNLEKLQDYINKNNIQTATEFGASLCARARRLGVYHQLFFPNPKKSKLEIEVEKVLNELNLSYITQKQFDDLIDKKPLRFDFYIESLNLCIEPGGRQHFTYVPNFFGETIEEFEKLKLHDQMKRDYCSTNNIRLLYYFEEDPKDYPGEWYVDINKLKARIEELLKFYNEE